MPATTSTPTNRVRAVVSHLAGPAQAKVLAKSKRWDQLPLYDELPMYRNFPGCAWSVWGEGDELGTVNLLTPEVVREAAKEIRYARTFPAAALGPSQPQHAENTYCVS